MAESAGPPVRVHFIADFNVETLARYVANTTLAGAETSVAPFGPVVPALARGVPDRSWSAVVWTRPETVSDAARRALAFEATDQEAALREVRAYAGALARFATGARAVLVPTWTIPPFERGYGMLDFRGGLGVAQLVQRMNLALADELRTSPNVFLLDSGRWLATTGARGWSQKLWYASKSPFAPALLEQAAEDFRAALDGLAGRSRRLIVLDLDNVLWGGIVGEVGWAGVRIGGHDHEGEAFADFQLALRGLARRGIQLAIVSKNDEAVALEAIDRHPEMRLRREHFAAWRINWNDKAANVADVLTELNLGAASAVFIDDSAVERARVETAVPGVLVPEWPGDPSRFREALASLRCFDAPALTAEDRARGEMYQAERSRRTSLAATDDLDGWLASLQIVVTVEPLTEANLDRAAQLFNKTNQMNLATRRLSASELKAWAADPHHVLLTFRVADRFGDSGLTGIASLAFEGSAARLVDFLMSCRVMGRKVEQAMLHVALAHCRSRGASRLEARFQPTERNGPCLEFLRRSGLDHAGDHLFVWDASRAYERPACVSVHEGAGVATGSIADR